MNKYIRVANADKMQNNYGKAKADTEVDNLKIQMSTVLKQLDAMAKGSRTYNWNKEPNIYPSNMNVQSFHL